MSINNTGVADTKDYWLGGGKLFLAELNDDETPKSFKQVGNVPDLTVTVSSETYEHFSSMQGIQFKDKTVVTQQNAEMGFSFENILDFDILKYFFSGTANAYVNPAVAGLSGTLTEDGNIVANSYFQLTDATNGNILGIDQANLVIETTNGTPVTLTQDVDYTVDEHNGMVFIKDTVIITTAIGAAEGLTYVLTADAQASDVTIMEAQTIASTTVAMKFISKAADSAVTDKTWEFHKVTLSADGDLGLTVEEVAQASMTGSIEKSTAYTGTITVYDADERTA